MIDVLDVWVQVLERQKLSRCPEFFKYLFYYFIIIFSFFFFNNSLLEKCRICCMT